MTRFPAVLVAVLVLASTATARSIEARAFAAPAASPVSGPAHVSGDITEFDGSPSEFQFVLDGQLIKGDDVTSFKGGRWMDLSDGKHVAVRGEQRDGFVLARDIHVFKK